MQSCVMHCFWSVSDVSKRWHFQIFFPMLFVAALPNVFTLDAQALDTSSIAFKPKTGAPPFGSFLQQTLDVSFVQPIFNQLDQEAGPLITRGEAHITVIAPTEFANVFDGVLSIQEINTIAKQSKIQSSAFSPICVARQSQIETKKTAGRRTDLIGKRTFVYNILVQAPQLVSIRQSIANAFVQKGGDATLFNATDYTPHITLGFENHDWFPENGVYKVPSTCFATVNVQ
ncbi:hypothetical protein EDD86DRAFT_208804 [Gorgonomyces haynaldii]|nr:hypothetical protein EDD86DRAFT_208804 [Gorgonomyces haynaldii]